VLLARLSLRRTTADDDEGGDVVKLDRLEDDDQITNGLTFRFDAIDHIYTALDTGEELPHITGMLERTGWISSEWFTEEGSDRGTCVHELTKHYDLGSLDVPTCVSPFRGYLLAHVAAMGMVRPTWDSIEVPYVHPTLRYGGRPDRVGLVYRCRTVGEVKSGAPQKSDAIQLALQAILVAGARGGLPATHYERLGFYLRASGRFKVERFPDRRDFDEAHRIIKTCCPCR
jgi:hypothetical protein